MAWGGDRLAKIGQVPFLVLAGIAAFRLARMLGASRNSALVAVSCFLTSTPFLIFSFEANVDTIFVAFYLTAVYYFLERFQQPASTPALVLGGLAAGIALGTKPVGVVFIPPLLALVLVVTCLQSRSIKQTLATFVIMVVCLVLGAGFWFGRNLLMTGNPLYPLHIELFGKTLLSGWYGRDVMRYSVYYIPMSDWRAFVDILLAMADPRLVPFWIAALGGAWAISGRPASGNDRWTWALAALAVLNVALYWFCIPYRTQPRFMFQALGLAAVPLARLLDRGRGLRVAAVVMLSLHLLTPQAWPVASQESEIPWDCSPLIKNAVGSPLLLFTSMAGVLHPGAGSPAIPNLVILLGMGFCAGLDGLGSQPDRSAHCPSIKDAHPHGGRQCRSCRTGWVAHRGRDARCQAALLSAFSRLLPRLDGSRGPFRAIGRWRGLCRNQHSVLPVRNRSEE